MFLLPARPCLTLVMWLMLGWPKTLICTLWVWWRGAQVNTNTDYRAAQYWWLDLNYFLINHLPWPFSSSAHLQAAVVLSPRYPEISPLFSLSLSWKGERSGRTDDNLRVWTLFSVGHTFPFVFCSVWGSVAFKGLVFKIYRYLLAEYERNGI